MNTQAVLSNLRHNNPALGNGTAARHTMLIGSSRGQQVFSGLLPQRCMDTVLGLCKLTMPVHDMFVCCTMSVYVSLCAVCSFLLIPQDEEVHKDPPPPVHKEQNRGRQAQARASSGTVRYPQDNALAKPTTPLAS
jgi:hypothetical protein